MDVVYRQLHDCTIAEMWTGFQARLSRTGCQMARAGYDGSMF